MAKVTGLRLSGFSVVRGDDVQPANPEAVAFVYKAQEKPQESNMAKTSTTPTEPTKKSIGQQVADAVRLIVKGQQTRTSVYESSSRETSTYDDGQEAAGDTAEAPTVIVIENSAPVEPATEPITKTTPASDPIPGVTDIRKALEDALNPFTDVVTKLAARIAKLETAPLPSRVINKGVSLGAQVTDNSGARFPEFSKFLSDAAGLTPGQKISKATISSATFGSYGLGFEESGTFIDYIVDQSALLKAIRTVKMKNARQPIDKLGLGSKVMVKGTPGTDPGDTVSINNSQVMLTCQEIMGIVVIGDDTLEDNIEGDAFVQHLLGMVGRAASNEMDEAAMLGDIAVASSFILDRWDGFYKQAKAGGAHVIEAMADADRYWPGTNGKKMTKVLKAIPSKYRIDPKMLRVIQNPDIYLDYMDTLTNTGSVPGTAAITGIQDLPIRSVPNLQMPYLSETQSFTYSSTPHTDGTFIMVTNPQNLILGIHREIKIEPFREPRKRQTSWTISMRGDVKIENADAIGIYDHALVQP